MALWDEIDEPVLRWVRSLPPVFDQDRTYEMATREAVACEHIAGLQSDQVHEALQRLRGAGLVDGQTTEYVNGAKWYDLRVTAAGLTVMDQWPDLDRVVSVAGLQLLLQQFADSATNNEDKGRMRRAAGAVGRLGDELVRGTIRGVGGSAGGALTSPENDPGGTNR